MTNLSRIALPFLAAAALAACSEAPPTPEVQTGSLPVRPADPAANLPSDSGAQTTLPSGAVTGAGQPQGTVVQPDVGSPGGLEPRARQEERSSMASPGAAADRSAAAGTERAAPDSAAPLERAGGDSAVRVEDRPARTPATPPVDQLARQSRG